MLWVIIGAAWYFLGMLCFYHYADFNDPTWANIYYLWDKGKDVLFTGAITYLTAYGKWFKLIFWFCIIRFLWEIVAITISMSVNNNNVIDWLFLIFLLVWMFQMVKEGIEWRKQN